MKTVIVCGAGGFLGQHLVHRLKKDGHYVRAFGRHSPLEHEADEYHCLDLRYLKAHDPLFRADEVYQLACEVGGLGYIHGTHNDVAMLSGSLRINLAVLEACVYRRIPKIFFSSTACVYPELDDHDPRSLEIRPCCEDDAYPVQECIGAHAWEKIYSERLYDAYARNCGLQVRIARFHNTYGPLATWRGGREKSVAALCRKVAQLPAAGGKVEVWGNGQQTRSFTYVDDAVEGAVRLMASDFQGPVNIGSTEMVSIDDLVRLIARVADKPVEIVHVPGPVGVRGRNSDNRLLLEHLKWEPTVSLVRGVERTYTWVAEQARKDLTKPQLLDS